ncbi:unnamed protein product [Pleuronectes platessa]|uniref:Uncharacterized protein n=1 Tax=Pleuronectes platessa TaxID=8262 RepID=A0A9N7YMS8_PLEPL|nr:unnamed protein product [Pleuronectes platessa]
MSHVTHYTVRPRKSNREVTNPHSAERREEESERERRREDERRGDESSEEERRASIWRLRDITATVVNLSSCRRDCNCSVIRTLVSRSLSPFCLPRRRLETGDTEAGTALLQLTYRVYIQQINTNMAGGYEILPGA